MVEEKPVVEEKPEPVVETITKEQLNDALMAKFGEIGDRAPLDAVIRKYLPEDTNHVGINGVPESSYADLLRDVEAL